MKHLLGKIRSLGRLRFLVIGDVILDRYTWGDAERVSPEAPVMVLRVDKEEVRLGGAGSVAALLQAFDAEVTLMGVTGDDAGGRTVRKLCQDGRIRHLGLLTDAARATTEKERFIGRAAQRHPQQMLRVDREAREPLQADLEQHLLQAILRDLHAQDAVLIADYAKGVCSPSLLHAVIDRARERGLAVFIDPGRITDYDRYRHATALTPNRFEMELASGRKITSLGDARDEAMRLRQRLRIDAVVLKLDRDGIALATSEGVVAFPTHEREVYDVTGAGDMVLAMVSLSRTSGLTWEDTVQLANIAAGLEIQKMGVVPISKVDLIAEVSRSEGQPQAKCVSLDEMADMSEQYRQKGKKLVLTNGCFDLMHFGHTSYLAEAARLGDVLIVAVNSDASVRRLKGPPRPILPENERAAIVAALECVDHVLVFEEDTPHAVLRRVRPDVLVKGGTYAPDQVVGREVVEEYGGQVFVTGNVPGRSTSQIVSMVQRFAD